MFWESSNDDDPAASSHARSEPNDITAPQDASDGDTPFAISETAPSATTSSRSKFRANKFLRVHLQVLKALYQEPEEDHRVEEQYWRSIASFLTERKTCAKLVKRAQTMGGICEEAMGFQKQVSASCTEKDMIVVHQLSPRFHRKSGGGLSRSSGLITQPSPYYSHRPPTAWNSAAAVRSTPRTNTTTTNNNTENEYSPFGIVSGLLQRKHRLAAKNLKQRTTNLRGLVTETRDRIRILESRLHSARTTHPTNTSSIEEQEDYLVRIETKLGLWKLLHRDLMGTLLLKE